MNSIDPMRSLITEIVHETVKVLVPHLKKDAPYTTGKAGNRPEGTSNRWLVEHAPYIPGARKIGRTWSIPVDAFDAWVLANQPVRPMPTEVDDPAGDLEALGYREVSR